MHVTGVALVLLGYIPTVLLITVGMTIYRKSLPPVSQLRGKNLPKTVTFPSGSTERPSDTLDHYYKIAKTTPTTTTYIQENRIPILYLDGTGMWEKKCDSVIKDGSKIKLLVLNKLKPSTRKIANLIKTCNPLFIYRECKQRKTPLSISNPEIALNHIIFNARDIYCNKSDRTVE